MHILNDFSDSRIEAVKIQGMMGKIGVERGSDSAQFAGPAWVPAEHADPVPPSMLSLFVAEITAPAGAPKPKRRGKGAKGARATRPEKDAEQLEPKVSEPPTKAARKTCKPSAKRIQAPSSADSDEAPMVPTKKAKVKGKAKALAKVVAGKGSILSFVRESGGPRVAD